MIFLRTKRDWQYWARAIETKQATKFEVPKEFPCFAYTIVLSYGYEEDGGVYLYRKDIEAMQKQISTP